MSGASDTAANVVLTADVSQYNQAMASAQQQTNTLAQSYQNLKGHVDHGLGTLSKVAFGMTAADVATIGAGVAMAARFNSETRTLTAQAAVLGQQFGQTTQRTQAYTQAVDNLRSTFGSTTQAAAQLVQTVSGFANGGSTQGLQSLTNTFSKMAMTTGENASALAQAILTLSQASGTGLDRVKSYADQITTMAAASNTTAEALANFAASITPLGRQLNMSESDINGVAAAFSKAGQDGYRASNLFSQMTSDIAQAMQTNSPRLREYANLLGMSVQNFKALSGTQQISGLFSAIGNQGAGGIQALDALGYNGIQAVRTVTAVNQQSGGLANMIRQSNASYGNGAAGAGKETFGETWDRFRQSMEQAGEALGQRLLPLFQAFADGMVKVGNVINSVMQGPIGTLITAFAGIAAPVLAAAGALLALRKAALLAFGLTSLMRTSAGQGFLNGIRGGGAIGSGLERDMGAILANDPRLASRPWVRRGYNMGNRAGGLFGRPFRTFFDTLDDPMMARGMGWQGGRWRNAFRNQWADWRAPAETAEEDAGDVSMATKAGRFGKKAARFSAAAAEQYIVNPQFDQARFKNPLDRQGFMGFLDPVKDALTSFTERIVAAAEAVGTWTTGMMGAAGDKIGGMAAKIGGGGPIAGEEEASIEAGKFGDSLGSARAALAGFAAGIKEDTAAAVAAMKLWIKTHGDEQEAMTIAAKQYGEMDGAVEAVRAQFNALQKATEDLAVSMEEAGAATAAEAKAAATQSVGASLQGMLGAGMGAAAGTAEATGGVLAGLGGGLMDLLTGPVGMAAMIGIPLISSLFSGGGEKAPPPSMNNALPVNTPLGSSIVAPHVDQSTGIDVDKNPMNPTDAFQATANGQKSYTNASVAALGTSDTGVQQALAIYGPTFNAYPAGSQQKYQLGLDLSQKLGRKGYQDFLAGLPKLPVGGYNAQSYVTASGVNGGIGALQAAQQDYLQYAGYDSSGAANMAMGAMVKGVLTGTTTGRYWDLKNMGSKGGENNLSFSNLIQNDPGSGDQHGAKLSSAGFDFVHQLDGGKQNVWFEKDTANALGKLAEAHQKVTSQSYLSNLNNWDLQQIANNMGMGDTAANQNQTQNMNMILAAWQKQGTKGTSDLKALGINAAGQQSVANSMVSNPQLAAAVLLGGKGTNYGSLLNLQIQHPELAAVTQAAQQQYAQNLQTMQPMMSQGMQIFGADSGFKSGYGNYNTSLEGQFQAASSALAANPNSPDAIAGVTSSGQNLQSAMMGVIQQAKQWNQTMSDHAFSQQQFDQSQEWQRQAEGRQVQRAEADFALQRHRSEADYYLQRQRSEQDFNLQRSRAQQDYDYQQQQMIKQAAMSMMNIYKTNPVQPLTSANFLLYNNKLQTGQMKRQEQQLQGLRTMGLSDNAIQQLDLTNASNNQELNTLFAQIKGNPALIAQLNSGVNKRLGAAGALVTDKSSLQFQQQQHQFVLSMSRNAQDFNTQMMRSQADFNKQMNRSEADFRKSMDRQSQDFAISQNEAAIQFHQSWAHQMADMAASMAPVSDATNTLAAAAKSAGPKIGGIFTQLQNSLKNKTLASVLNGTYTLPNGMAMEIVNVGSGKDVFGQLLNQIFGKSSGGGGFFSSLFGGKGGGGAGDGRSDGTYNIGFTPTSGMCLADVERAFGAPGNEGTALDAWGAMAGHRHPGMAPAGVPVFFGAPHGKLQDGTIAGHVAISAGGGMMWSEDSGNRWALKPIWGTGYLGWTDALNGVQIVPGASGFAKGAWNVDADQAANIHKGEMILPSRIAEGVRQAVGGGYGISADLMRGMHCTSAPVTQTVNNAQTYHTDSSTNFNGEVTVVASDPMEMAQQLRQQARLQNASRR